YHVRLRTVNQIRRQFIFEGAVTVRTFAEIVTINPNLTITVDAVKFDEDQSPLRRRGNSKRLAIPTDTTGQCSAACASRVLLTKLSLNAPVVWQIQLPPLRIV